MKKKTKAITLIALVIIIIIFSILLILKNKKPEFKIKGTWTTDGVTIYKFNEDNTGSLIVSLKEYAFTYKIDKNTLEINFENEKSTDSKYIYTLEDNTLILNGDNGKFTFIRK